MDLNKRKLIKNFMYLSTSLSIKYVYSKPSDITLDKISKVISFNKESFVLKVKNKVSIYELKNILPVNSHDFQIVYDPNNPTLLSNLFVAIDETATRSHYDYTFINTASNFSWVKVDYTFTLDDFGAIPDPQIDSSEAIQTAFNSGLKLTVNSACIYLLRETIIINEIPWFFTGAGIGKTIFYIDHFNDAFVFGRPVPSQKKYPVDLSGFSVKRLKSSLYSGLAGAKGIYIGNGTSVTLSYIEECYGIGYGIHLDYSENILVKNCYIHDHKGMSAGSAGTDGIHFYRSKNISAYGNIIHDVGDDALSAGSFDVNFPVSNVIFKNNRIYSTKGGIKFYSFVDNVLVEGNKVVACREGGVYLTDDKNSPDHSLVKNVLIKNNSFVSIGVLGKSDEAGALRIRFWPKINSGSKISDISFIDNNIFNSRVGVSELAYTPNKRLSNLYILNNKFSFNPSNHIGIIKDYYINITQCDNDIVINDNKFLTKVEYIMILNDKFGRSQQMHIQSKNNVIAGNDGTETFLKTIS